MTTRGTLRLWDIQGKRWRGPESGSGDKSGPCRGETWSRDVITQAVAGEERGPPTCRDGRDTEAPHEEGEGRVLKIQKNSASGREQSLGEASTVSDAAAESRR